MSEARRLWDLVEDRARQTPAGLFALDESDRRLSFEGLRDEAENLAAWLHSKGIGEDTPVSWILPTRISAFVLMVALARLGAVQNPLLPIYRRREIEFCTRQTGARFLIVSSLSETDAKGAETAQRVRDLASSVEGLRLLEISDPLPKYDPGALPRWPADEAGSSAPVRWVFYTSGTTADPKGAMHTDESILCSSKGLVEALELGPGCRTGVVFPVTHLGGANALVSTLQAGSTQLVVERFDPATTVPFLAKHGVTHAGAGTVFYQAYLEAQRAAGPEPIFPRLRTLYGGGAPTPPSLHRAVREELGGLGILSTYGMTECPVITMARASDPESLRGTTEGRPTHPETRVRIVAANGQELGTGEEGEILIHAPQCMHGYVDATLDAAAFDSDGYLRTGDLGRLNADGALVLTGRKKDVIIRKGENISAHEVETLLAEHPAVAEVVVIGLPDRERGELCCAVVRDIDPGAPLEFEAMIEYLIRRDLMRQKVPERLEHVGEFPRNPSGKVLKDVLKGRYAPQPATTSSV